MEIHPLGSLSGVRWCPWGSAIVFDVQMSAKRFAALILAVWRKGRPVQRRAAGVLAVGGASLLAAVSVMLGWPDWPGLGRWARPHAALLVLLAVTVVCVAAGLWLLLRGGRPPSSRVPAMSWWIVAGAAVVVTLVVWGATSWLLGEAASAKDVGAARVDAIKTGLGIGAGTTGIFALLLAVRRQWHNEVDATEKNVTELYTKAADQLGSDRAPVRLAGLYALERLAHGNPRQRQSIVNVICAYLRMPYTPTETPPSEADEQTRARYRESQHEQTQEREVRFAAQRILTDHLQPHRVEAFWGDIDLDLTNAYLIDFNMQHRRTRNARFGGATFTGNTFFKGVTITGNALFDRATFTGSVLFDDATFTSSAWFESATFASHAFFKGATFIGDAQFGDATFTGFASFDSVTFTAGASFGDTTFTDNASFDGTTFITLALFDDATFTGRASFDSVTFASSASFDGATFSYQLAPSFKAANFPHRFSVHGAKQNGNSFVPPDADSASSETPQS